MIFRGACKGVLGTEVRKEKKKKKIKIPKLVAYGCQTTSAQRRSDQLIYMLIVKTFPFPDPLDYMKKF